MSEIKGIRHPNPYIARNDIVGPIPANPINPPSYFVHRWDLP